MRILRTVGSLALLCFVVLSLTGCDPEGLDRGEAAKGAVLKTSVAFCDKDTHKTKAEYISALVDYNVAYGRMTRYGQTRSVTPQSLAETSSATCENAREAVRNMSGLYGTVRR